MMRGQNHIKYEYAALVERQLQVKPVSKEKPLFHCTTSTTRLAWTVPASNYGLHFRSKTSLHYIQRFRS